MSRFRQWRRVGRAAAQAAAIILLAAGGVLAGQAAKEPELPSYTIPNIVAMVMCGVVVFIPCKLYRRS
jgi:hypothetical protein